MPKIPTVESMGTRPTPQTAKPVIPLRLEGRGRGGVLEAQALGELGEATAGLGNSLAALNAKDKYLLDQTRAEEATSQYLNELNRFTYDPNDGFLNRRAGNAIKTDLQKEYDEKRLEVAKKLDEGLSSVEQRNAFRQRVGLANRQFDTRLFSHVAEQTNAYHEQVYDGVIQSERSFAAANWQQPGVIESSVLRVHNSIDSEAVRKGIPEKTVAAMKEIEEAKIHSTIVEQMLVEGKDQAALAYYQGIEKRLTPESRITLGLKVKSASTDGEAMRGASAIWTLNGPQSEDDPVLIADMEAEARKQFGNDPRVTQSVISQLRSMAQAHSAQQNELIASRKASVLQAFHDGAGLAQLQTMPEYQDMDGSNKEELRQYVLSRGWTEQQRARSDAEWAEGEKGKQGFQKYWELSTPSALNGMSEKEILALEPQMGQKLVGDLVAKKRALASGGTILEATIDDDMFKVLATDAGLKPYAKNLSPDEKSYLGNLKNHVETLIDQEQQQLGRKLSRQEKEEVMRRAVDRKVIMDRGFFSSGREIPTGAVPAEKRTNIIVPITEVDPGWMGLVFNHMRTTGAVSFRLTDAEIKSKFRKRIEKAYAIRLSGGNTEEINRALRGE